MGSAPRLEADGRDDFVDEPSVRRHVFEEDLEMAYADVHQQLDLADRVCRRGAKVVEHLARIEAVLVGRFEGAWVIRHGERDAGGEHDLAEWPADRLAVGA
jgi:hypothetical protein